MTEGAASEPDIPEVDPETEANWRGVLLGTHQGFRRGRSLFRRLPHEPRCKFCAAPFAGPAAPLMRLIDKGPWPLNPKYCGACFRTLTRHGGGAEVPCSLLFADIRGSTALAETMTATRYKSLLDRFYAVAAEVLIDHNAIVDKFVGDEVFAIFIPALTGADHAGRAITAARSLLRALGYGGAAAPWLEVGVGVHSGPAYVGSAGAGSNVELTALGDTVNVAARLAAAAGPGEIIVSVAAAEAAAVPTDGLEHRDLALKGKSAPTPVVILRAA